MAIDDSRQGRSAGHYLTDESLTYRLMPTLVLAARTLGFAAAMVNILDQETQHTIALVGDGYGRSTPREETFCDVVVRSQQAVVVADARTDDRFANLQMVRDGDVRSYIGVPLIGRESLPVGAVCVVDREMQAVDEEQVARLVQFGKIVEDQLDLIRRLDGQRRVGHAATVELARANAAGEIVPWYQPLIDLSTGRLVGFEALARWEHPSGEVDDPNDFIPLAEDSDLIIDLDLSVMRQAFVDLKRWRALEPTLRMSVNLSARHFDHADWLLPITAATTDAGISPHAVDLELTETTRLGSGHADGAFVRKLQAHGFRVWLDDFGTGWSSLEYLLSLPADGIKIDRVIAVALGTQIGNALTRSVTGLARDLKMRTTIEGVETAEVAHLAEQLGCEHAQGFLWSAPVRAADVDLRLRERLVDPFPAARWRPISGPAPEAGPDVPAPGQAGEAFTYHPSAPAPASVRR